MSSSITLTQGVRSNLLALQQIRQQETTTQGRLATGKRVNSALDNPTEFFTAAALSARSGELTNLLDSMTNAVNTINAASNGLTRETSDFLRQLSAKSGPGSAAKRPPPPDNFVWPDPAKVLQQQKAAP